MRDTFRIASSGDLLEYKRIAEDDMTGNIPDAYLVRDIDMTGIDWDSITLYKRMWSPGVCKIPFIPFKNLETPAFDGDGHAIKGLQYSTENKCLLNMKIFPAPKACLLTVQPMGYLFNVSGNLKIRNLTLSGYASICDKPDVRSAFVHVVAGGLTGYVSQNGEIENCKVEVDMDYDQASSGVNCVAGIAGALEGKMKDCRYIGNITGGWGKGLAYMNSGLITDSYSTDKSGNIEAYPATMDKTLYVESSINIMSNYGGMADNISLYRPGGPYFKSADCLHNFFAGDTLGNLLRTDVMLEVPLKEGYWTNVLVHKIARTVEECCRAGHGFDKEGLSAVSCSLLPLRYCRCRTNREANMYASRYAAMIDALVKESPSFRKALLQEVDEDREKTIDILKGYMTSEKRVLGILKSAKKYEDYDEAVEADRDFIDEAYIR